MLMPLPGGLIPNDPCGGLIPGDPHGGRIPSDPPKGRIPGGPAPGGPPGNPRAGGGPAINAYPASPRHGKPRRDGRRKPRREGRRGSPPPGMGSGFLPAPPAGLLPGDPLGDPLSTDPARNPIPGDPPGRPVHATPATPGLNPGMVATITAQCPGLRVDHVLRHGGKSVLAGGYVGEQPVVIKMPGDTDPSAAMADYLGTFQLTREETLAGVLAGYEAAAAQTDRSTRATADLDRQVPLPATPWSPDGCTVRWILFHLIEETARHAGHADLLREALDGGLSGPLMAAAEGWPADGWVTPWRPPPDNIRS